MRRNTGAALAAVLALAVGGCGSSGGAAAPVAGETAVAAAAGGARSAAEGPDPCALLTGGEVAAVVGGAVTATAVSSPTGARGCRWLKRDNADGVPDLQLDVLSPAVARAFAHGLRSGSATGEQPETIGDGALLRPGLGRIQVLVGSTCFLISSRLERPLSDATVRGLATTVVSRLR